MSVSATMQIDLHGLIALRAGPKAERMAVRYARMSTVYLSSAPVASGEGAPRLWLSWAQYRNPTLANGQGEGNASEDFRTDRVGSTM